MTITTSANATDDVVCGFAHVQAIGQVVILDVEYPELEHDHPDATTSRVLHAGVLTRTLDHYGATGNLEKTDFVVGGTTVTVDWAAGATARLEVQQPVQATLSTDGIAT